MKVEPVIPVEPVNPVVHQAPPSNGVGLLQVLFLHRKYLQSVTLIAC